MHGDHKKYLKHWLACALQLEIFPHANSDELRKFSTVVLDQVDAQQRKSDSSGVETFQQAFMETQVRTELSRMRCFQNVPPEWLEGTLSRILDFGPLMYVQNTLLWMQGLIWNVRVASLKRPELAPVVERLEHCLHRAKQNGITTAEMEELKQQVYSEWAALTAQQP